MHKKLLISVMLVFAFTGVHKAAGAASLVDARERVELYATDGKTLSTLDAETIINSAVTRSTTGNVSWKVLGSIKGMMEVQGGKPGSHAVFILTYANNSIIMQYKESQGLKYRKSRQGRALIHPAYNKWVDLFVQEMVTSAKFLGNINLVTGTQKHIADQRAGGAALMIIAAEADPGFASGNKLTKKIWSVKIMQTATEAINEEFKNKIVAKPLPWGREMIRLARKGYSAKRNKQACEEHSTDRVLTVTVQYDEGDNTGTMYRDARLTYYDCKSDAIFTSSKTLNRTPNDSYSYEGAFRKEIPQFLKDNGINE